jgi:hypothetical protein
MGMVADLCSCRRLKTLLKRSHTSFHRLLWKLKCLCIMSMKRASLIIMVASLVCGGWPWSIVFAIQPCLEEPDQEPEKTKLLPIVRDRASLQKFNEQRVMVVGRYQRDTLKEIIRVSRQELEDQSVFEANKPRPPVEIQVHNSDLGFAQIVLADGVALPIEPRGRRSLRSKSELVKYDGKEVNLQGTVIWNSEASLHKKEINNITNLRLVCNATKSQSNTMNPDEWQGEKLAVAKTKTDLLKLLDNFARTKGDRRVQIVGKYVVTHTWNPGINANTINFKGSYQQAGIELVDGTIVPLIPPYHKLSLRSADEVKTYSGKSVKVVGIIELQPDSPSSKKSAQSIMLTSLDGIWLKE